MWFVLAVCAQPTDVEATRDAMAAHWSTSTALRDSVIAADLEGVKSKANSWLKAPKSDNEIARDARAVLEPHFRSLADAPDLESAAMSVGALGATCAVCHKQYKRDRSYLPPAPPKMDSTMGLHRAGSEWMWAGLVGDSEMMFRTGALTVLSSTLPNEPVEQQSEAAALAFEARVRSVASRSKQAVTAVERGEFYGKLLTACATCHTLTDGGPEGKGLPALPSEGLLVAEMHERYLWVDRAREALEKKSLQSVREAALLVSSVPPPKGLPPIPWRPWSAEVRMHAVTLSRASTQEEASRGLADLALACGGCHAAFGGGPHVPLPDERTGSAKEAVDILWWQVLSGASLHQADARASELVTEWSAK